jgi:hypothetical protein
MVVLEACQCEEGLGLAHSHAEERVHCRSADDFDVVGKTFTIPLSMYEMNRDTLVEISREPACIHIWIDWRSVAKVLLADG